MATIEYAGFRRQPRARALADNLLEAWRSLARTRVERRDLRAVAQLGPRLMRDAGLDPEGVDAKIGSGWDRLDPVGLKLLLRRDLRA
jgi:uncharacterized protein YjiS (DUF1127 family)